MSNHYEDPGIYDYYVAGESSGAAEGCIIFIILILLLIIVSLLE